MVAALTHWARHRGATIATGVVAALVPVAAPSVAGACGTGSWCANYAAPAAGATIPQNAPALVQFAASNQGGGDLQAPAELRGPDDERVAASTEADPAGGSERLLIPSSPLKPGRHVLVHGAVCNPGGVSNAFTVGPAVPLPTTIGTVRLEPQPAQTLQATWMDGCGWVARATAVRIVLQPSAELEAYLPLARFMVNIDGKPWATSAYGSDRVAPPGLPGSISVLRPYTFCDPFHGARWDHGPAGAETAPSGSIAPGRHRAALSVHIAGAPVDPPPLSFDLDTTCGDVPDGRSPPDAGSGPDGAGGGGVTPPARAGGGCAVAGAGSGGAWPLCALLAGALAKRLAVGRGATDGVAVGSRSRPARIRG